MTKQKTKNFHYCACGRGFKTKAALKRHETTHAPTHAPTITQLEGYLYAHNAKLTARRDSCGQWIAIINGHWPVVYRVGMGSSLIAAITDVLEHHADSMEAVL